MLWISHGRQLCFKIEIWNQEACSPSIHVCVQNLKSWQLDKSWHIPLNSKIYCTQWEELLICTRKGITSFFGIKKENLLVAFHSITVSISITWYSSFFKMMRFFVQLDELDELVRISDAWIWIHFTVSKKHRKYSSVMVKVLDCQASNPGSVCKRKVASIKQITRQSILDGYD